MKDPCAPALSPTGFLIRARLLFGCMAVVISLLCTRLLYIQVALGDHLREVATNQRMFEESISARPGRILDRRGRVLAASISSPSIYVVPRLISKPEEFAAKIAPILQRSPQDVCDFLVEYKTRAFMWLARRISQSELDQIRDLNLPANCWGVRQEFTRCYPQGQIAAHVIGLRNIDGQGAGGLEETFHDQLSGHPGKRITLRDSRGRVIETLTADEMAPVHGQDITCTLDLPIQWELEQRLEDVMKEWEPTGCCGVVIVPRTGEILAMGSRPAYDPNQLSAASPESWKNLALSAMFEPGSTFKPVIVSWGLQNGIIRKDEIFECEHGQYRMGGRTLHDHHSYGQLSLNDVLVKSSNIGMAKIGEKMGNPFLFEASDKFGFGRPTGVELPGELSGALHPLAKWTRYSTGSIPMGHELAATPLQVAQAMSIIASGGDYHMPHLVYKKTNLRDQIQEKKLIDESITRWMLDNPLAEVITRGTGQRAQSKHFNLFGKTGTAQKLDPKTGLYSHNKYVCTFVGGGPVEDPEVVAIIMVDEPHKGYGQTGGVVAAPACGKLIESVLFILQNQPPDEEPLPNANLPLDKESDLVNDGDLLPDDVNTEPRTILE